MASTQVPDPTWDSLRSLRAAGTSKSKEVRLDRLWKTFESDQLDPIYGVREISRSRLKIGSRDVFFSRQSCANREEGIPSHLRIVGTPIPEDTSQVG